MKTYHVDGGAFVAPPDFIFHDAYFSVINEKGVVVHVDKELGDMWSGTAEYMAIKWAVENIKKKPFRITSDCLTAIAWIKKGKKPSKALNYFLPVVDLTGVVLEYQHNNLADQYNARHISPKKDKAYYVQRWLKEKRLKLY